MTHRQVNPDDEFEEINERMSRIILVSSIMDINEMLIEEQWKRQGGQGSNWEQQLVKHKGELQQGLDRIKERAMNSSNEDAMTVDTKEIPSIVVQEPDLEDDRKMAYAFEGSPNSPQRAEVETSTSPQTLPASSPIQQMTDADDEFVITGFLSEEEASAVLSSLDGTELVQLSPSLQAKLRPDDTDFERYAKHINSELQIEGAPPKTSNKPLSTIDPDTSVADATSITQSVAPPTTQSRGLHSLSSAERRTSRRGASARKNYADRDDSQDDDEMWDGVAEWDLFSDEDPEQEWERITSARKARRVHSDDEKDASFPDPDAGAKPETVARGTKRGSDEAGLDEQGASQQVDVSEGDDSVVTPPKKRQETGDHKMTDSSPTNSPPKTPAKGKTPGKRGKATPSSLRQSRRQRHK